MMLQTTQGLALHSLQTFLVSKFWCHLQCRKQLQGQFEGNPHKHTNAARTDVTPELYWSKLADCLAKIHCQTFPQPKVPQDVFQFWRISQLSTQFLSKVLLVSHLHGSLVLQCFVIFKHPYALQCNMNSAWNLTKPYLVFNVWVRPVKLSNLCTHNQIRRQFAHFPTHSSVYKLAQATNTKKETHTKHLGISLYDANRVAWNPPSEEVGAGAPHHAPTSNNNVIPVSRHSRAIAECSSTASVQNSNSFQSLLERKCRTSAKATAYYCCHARDWATGSCGSLCKRPIPVWKPVYVKPCVQVEAITTYQLHV